MPASVATMAIPQPNPADDATVTAETGAPTPVAIKGVLAAAAPSAPTRSPAVQAPALDDTVIGSGSTKGTATRRGRRGRGTAESAVRAAIDAATEEALGAPTAAAPRHSKSSPTHGVSVSQPKIVSQSPGAQVTAIRARFGPNRGISARARGLTPTPHG